MGNENDYEWSNRILIWCVHILKLCFGDGNADSGPRCDLSKSEQWAALKSFEYDWNSRPPACFKLLYFEERDPERIQRFPHIWQTNERQAVGLQNIELGQIALAWYESKMQRLILCSYRNRGAVSKVDEDDLRHGAVP